jgi:hypothetical protein
MNDNQITQIRSELLSSGKDKEKITAFIEDLQKLLRMSDHNQPNNISRNVPLDDESKIRLKNIEKQSGKLLKELTALYKNKDLQKRLHLLEDHIEKTFWLVETLHNATVKTLENQIATADGIYCAGHLRPEYRGTRTTSHHDIEYLSMLRASLLKIFPDVRSSKNQNQTALFFRLAAIVLQKEDPTRTINRFVKITSQTSDV